MLIQHTKDSRFNMDHLRYFHQYIECAIINVEAHRLCNSLSFSDIRKYDLIGSAGKGALITRIKSL